jgi:hypothetical protein
VVVLQAFAGDQGVKFGLHGGLLALLALELTVEISPRSTVVSSVTRMSYN